ncbi:hypothetical protein [Cytobacillus dafuensis]|uniref:DUF4871 domain-containing protein n=1 Tax=Cytobacillus dafuensis TaxID=1742359 RepID=A0A5B8Z1E9_CYTDA|nr:hypothetical protein [Cytobacillus dafuensis]QED46587.1 hypothetical protein FSZ17_04455 [Cytobacillus dafuensis]
MKKIKNVTFLFVFIVLMAGCMKEEKGQLTRVDVQKMNPDGNYEDVFMITDSETIERITTVIENIKWEPNKDKEAEMARKADVKATLFFEYNKDMPERLNEYDIWFGENNGTATIISNNKDEGFGSLDKDNAHILKSELLSKTIDWKPRNEYAENDKVLFSIFPDPNLVAGKSYGYMFSFAEPFETYKGKKLAMYAYHKETGERITAVPPEKITEPSSGYPSLNRFTTFFELPIGGLWRIEVEFDGKFYGDVILNVPN